MKVIRILFRLNGCFRDMVHQFIVTAKKDLFYCLGKLGRAFSSKNLAPSRPSPSLLPPTRTWRATCRMSEISRLRLRNCWELLYAKLSVGEWPVAPEGAAILIAETRLNSLPQLFSAALGAYVGDRLNVAMLEMKDSS